MEALLLASHNVLSDSVYSSIRLSSWRCLKPKLYCKSHWNPSWRVWGFNRFQLTACWYSQTDSLDDKIYRYTSPHVCKKLHHLDIGSSTAAVACHWQDTFSAWLLVLPNASIRSVRHVSTIVALSVAEVPGWYRGGIRAVSGYQGRGQGLVLQRRSAKPTGWLLLF